MWCWFCWWIGLVGGCVCGLIFGVVWCVYLVRCDIYCLVNLLVGLCGWYCVGWWVGWELVCLVIGCFEGCCDLIWDWVLCVVWFGYSVVNVYMLFWWVCLCGNEFCCVIGVVCCWLMWMRVVDCWCVMLVV